MIVTASSTVGTSPLWYLTRSTALVGFVLLTLSFTFGLAATKRAMASRFWPRIATQELHRNISLLALGFIVVHILTTLADSFVTVGWWSAIIPGAAHYRGFWVALGTIAFDLIVVLIVSSLVRDRLPVRIWRGIHYAAYGVWPLAFFHFLKTGTDAAHGRWGLYLDVVCLLTLTAATALRWLTTDQPTGPIRSVTSTARSAR